MVGRGGKAQVAEISGVLNINKPAGITSHDVVDAVRKLLQIRKVGHTGTLDPIATGVLPLCVGRATKIAQYLTQADKEYLITMRLGVTTDTLDADGRILSQVEDFAVEPEKLEETLRGFGGRFSRSPRFSRQKRWEGSDYTSWPVGGQRSSGSL